MDNIQKTTVHALTDLLSVQTGAVVSRTLINQKTGTITLFAFDQGEGLSEHSAPYDAYVQVLEGMMEISIGGERFNVSAGEMIIMPADIPHALTAATPAKMLLVMIRA